MTWFQTMVCTYLPTMVPEPWFVTDRIFPQCRAKQLLSFYKRMSCWWGYDIQAWCAGWCAGR
ncbi:hypothetical protein L873DRAFT_74946 [Choiromyces venosus 120613-1]|uniref:Uncharacterized protein n=1 Tax=Choiromyces venosus 120613-1 TaxID=1336337 RepID=A0A3N4J4K2_9PEZI|nr:hypothetical protein L873DRAFT_74946 [Choiromyces venosus 120613-1]